jgi:diguanylate cyclase (GGDEF)-like protein
MARPSIAPAPRIGRTTALSVSLFTDAAVGFLDYVTGWQIWFSIFYLAPILLATWYGSTLFGVIIACFSTVLWLVSDLMTALEYDHAFIPYWNAAVRFAFFFLLAMLLGKLKDKLVLEKAMARTDGLTGAYNSRAFYELAEAELRRAKRYGHPFTLAYIDLDNFKHMNDSKGHITGDEVLCVVVDALQQNIRDTDAAARLGGDEFAVMFIETGGAQSSAALKKMRAQLNLAMTERKWPVTFSIGAITYHHALPVSVKEMISAADHLMYQAKARGKNQTVLADFSQMIHGAHRNRATYP